MSDSTRAAAKPPESSGQHQQQGLAIPAPVYAAVVRSGSLASPPAGEEPPAQREPARAPIPQDPDNPRHSHPGQDHGRSRLPEQGNPGYWAATWDYAGARTLGTGGRHRRLTERKLRRLKLLATGELQAFSETGAS